MNLEIKAKQYKGSPSEALSYDNYLAPLALNDDENDLNSLKQNLNNDEKIIAVIKDDLNKTKEAVKGIGTKLIKK